jgi:translation initiation factor 4E
MLAAIGETFDPALSQSSAAADADADGQPAPPSARSIVTGVIVSARPTFYRISIWTRLAASPNSPQDPPPGPDTPPNEQGDALIARIEAIGRYFKHSVLGYTRGTALVGPMSTEVEFVSHKDSEKKSKGAKKFMIL